MLSNVICHYSNCNRCLVVETPVRGSLNFLEGNSFEGGQGWLWKNLEGFVYYWIISSSFLKCFRGTWVAHPPYPWALSICFKESQSATCCVNAGQHIIYISLLTLKSSNMCYLITYISTHIQLFIKHFLSLCYVAFLSSEFS